MELVGQRSPFNGEHAGRSGIWRGEGKDLRRARKGQIIGHMLWQCCNNFIIENILDKDWHALGQNDLPDICIAARHAGTSQQLFLLVEGPSFCGETSGS